MTFSRSSASLMTEATLLDFTWHSGHSRIPEIAEQTSPLAMSWYMVLYYTTILLLCTHALITWPKHTYTWHTKYFLFPIPLPPLLSMLQPLLGTFSQILWHHIILCKCFLCTILCTLWFDDNLYWIYSVPVQHVHIYLELQQWLTKSKSSLNNIYAYTSLRTKVDNIP